VVDRFYASVVELSQCPLLLCDFHTGIRAIASKTTTTTKFEVEKFDRKSNFLLWKMQITAFLVKESTHKALLSVEKKPSK